MDLLTLQQAMQRLGISDSTMRRYMKKKKLPYQKIQGRYYFLESDVNKLLPKQSDAQEAIHEIFTRISSIEQEIEALRQQLSQLTRQVQQISSTIQAHAQSSSGPPTAQPPPMTHSEQVKPSVAHSSAKSEGQPEGTITLPELAKIVDRNVATLKGHLKKYDERPEYYPQFTHVKVPIGSSGQNRRYFTPEQVETWTAWIAANTKKGAGD